MKAVAIGLRTLGWAAGGLAAGIVLAVAAPLAVGQRPYTVLTGSMEPAIGAGDVVVVKRIAPRDARVGDVVTFSDPNQRGRLITHRVRSARPRAGQVDFVTKGDANNAPERWRVATDGEISRVQYRVPEVGRLARFAHTGPGLLLLVLGPLLLLAAQEIVRIWRPRRELTGEVVG